MEEIGMKGRSRLPLVRKTAQKRIILLRQ